MSKVVLITLLLCQLTLADSTAEAFRYHNKKYHFSINLPSQWKIEEDKTGAAVTIVRPRTAARETFLESVNVVVQTLEIEKQIKTLVQENVSQLRRTLEGFHLSETGRMKNAEGNWIVYTYGDKLRVTHYQSFFVIGKKSFTITGSATALTFSKYRPLFEKIAASFKAE